MKITYLTCLKIQLNTMNFFDEQVKAENPGLSVTELSKVIGAKWREMSAEDKELYEEKARKDKQRFGGVLY